MKMKRILALLFLTLAVLGCLTACGKTETEKLWEKATYRQDKAFGEGAKTATVEVKVGENAVKFTLHTDKETLGDALMENGLIAGDEGPYGLYVKVVNGITADYDVDQSYWAFYLDGEMAMTGVDGTAIVEGADYQLVYTK